MDSNHRPHAYQACALTSWAISPYDGGEYRARTDDLMLAKHALSQLSYTPADCPLSSELRTSKIKQRFPILKNPAGFRRPDRIMRILLRISP